MTKKLNNLSRNYGIDILKAFAIIAVVLYHLGNGILPFGYLGVEIFLVISGYFLMNGMISSYQKENRTYYFRDLIKRICRLWPLIIAASIISFVIGYFLMLPDDFENLSASVVASGVFANNILACITTKNYWDIVNTYKPLMHMWYVGLLMQAYVVLPLLLKPIFHFSKENSKKLRIGVFGLLAITFLLYVLPISSTAQKFYYLPFRLFELLAGAAVAVLPESFLKEKKKLCWGLFIASAVIILIMNVTPVTIISPAFMLIATVLCTAIALITLKHLSFGDSLAVRVIAYIGQASFSVYIWHQVIVAFMYYSFVQTLTWPSFVIFVLITTVVSILSYRFIEVPLSKIKKIKHQTWLAIVCFVMFLVVGVTSLACYKNAGVVRDVDELGISKETIKSGMHSEYNDRVYSWDKDFTDSEGKKVLVFGDSFGRDFANILSESPYGKGLQISYIYISDVSVGVSRAKYQNRIESAEIIFFAPSANFDSIPQWLTDIASEDKIYVVGTKNFGNTNGIIYAKRNSADYFNQRVSISKDFIERDIKQKNQYNSRYISLLEVVMNENGEVRVFTDDGKFISQDCRHLTQFGAQFYASKLDLSWLAAE